MMLRGKNQLNRSCIRKKIALDQDAINGKIENIEKKRVLCRF